jgi:WLM domain
MKFAAKLFVCVCSQRTHSTALLSLLIRWQHVNPILRERGWRVKRLIESASHSWIGLCTGNGRNDADAASVNIQLNLRSQPNRRCPTFRSFQQVLAVMLHEISHTSIGLEDIHPPAFYELLDEITQQYRKKLRAGAVAMETDDYGCSNVMITKTGELKSIQEAASDTVDNDHSLEQVVDESECGARRRWRRRRRTGGDKRKGVASNVPKRLPLLKGAKMIDGRTRAGRQAKKRRDELTPRELAARAAMVRMGQTIDDGSSGSEQESSSDDDEPIAPHKAPCGCRSCVWENLLV